MNTHPPLSVRDRHLRLMGTPRLWIRRPFLPLIRPSGDDWPELGLLYDIERTSQRTGFETTVFLANLLDIGTTIHSEADFLALPHRRYQTHAAIYDDGWRVD